MTDNFQLSTLHSQLPKGYKQTEVGVIPEEWESVQLTTVAKLESGHTPSRRIARYWNGTIPWVSLHDTEALDGREIHATQKCVTQEGIDNSSARVLPRGTVVFSRTATVGKTTVLGREMATSQDFANYICGPLVFNHFLVYLFRFMAPEWKRLMAGSIHNTVYMPVFQKLKVILPPPAEQRAIAAALSDVDALLAKLDQLIAKKRDLKQAAMQQLLTGQTRLPGFRGAWEVKRLGDICPLQRGFDLPTTELRAGIYPVVYSNGVLNYHTVSMVRGPGVVTGRSGTIGNVHYVDSDFWPHNTSLWVTNFKGNSPKFIYYLLTVVGLEKFGTGSGVPTLNRNDVHAHSVRVPSSSDEQTAIATVLSDMDAELAALVARRDKTRALKQGMMQELLTGRIRLVESGELKVESSISGKLRGES